MTANLGLRWGALIAARRADLHLSQSALADLCSVSQQTISKIERGLMVPLDPLKLRLAAGLDVHPGDLFPWPEPVPIA